MPEQPPAHRPAESNDPVAGPGVGGSLQAPWRLEYLQSLGEQERRGTPPPTPPGKTGVFLRDHWLEPERDVPNLVIVRRGELDDPCAGMILLNAFPYANGHLLVALGEGRPSLLDYTPQQRAALWRLTDTAAALMQAALEPQGINIGINQGRAAGAGVPGHLHVHLVPRWGGDVNFITVVGRIRVIPSSLERMAQTYRDAWARVRHDWA